MPRIEWTNLPDALRRHLFLRARERAISDYMFEEELLSTSVVDAGTQSITGVTEKTLTLNYTMSSFMGIVGIDGIPVTFSRPIFSNFSAQRLVRSSTGRCRSSPMSFVHCVYWPSEVPRSILSNFGL